MRYSYLIKLSLLMLVGGVSSEELHKANITDKVLFDIEANGMSVGTIEIGLFGEIVEKTVHNFKVLCNRPRGLGYKGSKFHRIIKDFMIQGGDFTNGDGTGGYSIYGESFADENFKLKHGQYFLSMANSGKDTNGSQFFITTIPTPWLNGRHVVFGKVLNGANIVQFLDGLKTDVNDQPLINIVIANCNAFSIQHKPIEISI